jgi:hypothetical protein
MMTKKVLLVLAASGLLAFGTAAPVLAEDPPAQSDDGSNVDVPADPDSADQGESAPDPGTDEGGSGDTTDSSGSGGSQDGGGSDQQ